MIPGAGTQTDLRPGLDWPPPLTERQTCLGWPLDRQTPARAQRGPVPGLVAGFGITEPLDYGQWRVVGT